VDCSRLGETELCIICVVVPQLDILKCNYNSLNDLCLVCRVDSIEKLRGKLPSLRAELKDDRKFSFFRSNCC
jgi:hypothetical protein